MILAVRQEGGWREGGKALRVVGAMVLFWLREKEASPSFEQMAVRGGQGE